MKRIYGIVSALILLTCSSASAFWGGPIYYVIFEKSPNIINEKVYAMDFEIGDIKDKELGNNSIVMVTIKLEKKHKELVRQNGAFVVVDGRLIYESLGGDDNTPLESKSRVLGFASRADMVWFQTKSIVSKFADASLSKIQELYKKYQ